MDVPILILRRNYSHFDQSRFLKEKFVLSLNQYFKKRRWD